MKVLNDAVSRPSGTSASAPVSTSIGTPAGVLLGPLGHAHGVVGELRNGV